MGYDVGDVWPIVATFTDSAGDPLEPTDVVITVQAPDGTQSTPDVTLVDNVATTNVVLTEGGYWHAIIDPEGIEGVERYEAYATPLPFTPA